MAVETPQVTPNSETSQSTKNLGWIVTFAALGINLVLGVLYAWGVVAKVLADPQTGWGWKKATAAIPFTVSTIAFAITMIFAGRAQDKIGPRLVAILGGLMLGAGLILASFIQKDTIVPFLGLTLDAPMLMVLTFGVVGGMGIGLGYSATTPPSVKWFPASKKGLIAGLVVAGVGLAAVWISPLTTSLLKNYGVSKTFLFLGLGTIVIVSIFAQFLKNPPAGYKPAASPSAAGKKPAITARRDIGWTQMLATRQFWLLWLMFILAASAGLMVIAHAAIIAKEQAGMVWGFMPIVLLAIFNTVGRIVGGYVSDRIGRTQTMVLAFILQAINMFLFAHYKTPEMLLFGASFTGLCYGTIYTLMPMAVADFYGLKNLGMNYGILFTAFGFAGVVGPIIGGIIRDKSGTYNTSYLISAILLIIAAALAFITRAPKPDDSATE